jgi:hypothetical protein
MGRSRPIRQPRGCWSDESMLSQCSSRSFGSSCHSCRPERWPARAWPRPRPGLAFQRGVAAAQVSPQRQSIWPWPSQRKAQNRQCSMGKSRKCWCRVSSTRPGGQPPTRLSSCSKASSWLAVIRSRSSVHRHGRCVRPQTRVVAVSWGLDARVWGKSVSRACRSAGTNRQAHRQLLGAATASTSQAPATIRSRRPIQVRN